MNVVLLVIDSLRSCSLVGAGAPSTPFLRRLAQSTTEFRRAYASECWTLPTHMSMFTGLLPSEHGAHFQSMAYTNSSPTIAEILAQEGFQTEVITRNPIFDGSLPGTRVPGVTRGFRTNTSILSARSSGFNPLSLVLALSKPRFRKQVRTTGFFSQGQRESLSFLQTFTRATVPADTEALAHILARMDEHRRNRQPYFLFCNLFDIHAPYPPSRHSIFRSPWSWRGLDDNLRMPFVMPSLGGHRYLESDFRISAASRRMLLARYHDAIELMDAKLDVFYTQAVSSGFLDDTMLIVTSDHGEAFGEHGLYLHDASVYDTHLHVPLLVHHPEVSPTAVDDVVSTRDLFGLFRSVALNATCRGTILDPQYRAEHPIALAEHFHYRGRTDIDAKYKQNLLAAITAEDKVVVRRGENHLYSLTSDPDELAPEACCLSTFKERCKAIGMPAQATTAAMNRLHAWHP